MIKEWQLQQSNNNNTYWAWSRVQCWEAERGSVARIGRCHWAFPSGAGGSRRYGVCCGGWYPQSALFSLFVNGMRATQKSNGERESPWNIPLLIWMGCDSIISCFVFKKSLVFHFSIDSLQNLTILLFTPTNAIDFSTQLCGTLSNAFW